MGGRSDLFNSRGRWSKGWKGYFQNSGGSWLKGGFGHWMKLCPPRGADVKMGKEFYEEGGLRI